MNLMSFEGIIFDSFKSILWNSRNKLSPNQLLFGSSDQTNTNDETELIIDALNQCSLFLLFPKVASRSKDPSASASEYGYKLVWSYPVRLYIAQSKVL